MIEKLEEKIVKEVGKRGFDLNQEVYSAHLEGRCSYHPQVDAISKCEQCGGLICGGCSVIYRGDFILDVPEVELCFRCCEEKTRADRVFELWMYRLLLFVLASGVFGFVVNVLLFAFP